jgi:hypothetical protein
MGKVNLREKFALFADRWSPKVVGELNGQHVKLVKLLGEFAWHRHDGEDELQARTRAASHPGEGGPMGRRRYRGSRRSHRPAGFTPPGMRELYNVALPMPGAVKRRFFNDLSDRLVVMAGVAAAVVGYGSGGVLGAMIGLALGLLGAGRAMVGGRFRRG